MKNEEWRDVVGYEGLYQVSSEGRVKSLERTDRFGRVVKERVLKQDVTHDGYLRVCLYASDKRKWFRVHRLVCEAFRENPEDKPEVNHIDEDKTNNNAVNLEWCTRKENINHGSRNERARKAKSKSVGQYTRDGELIKIWPSTIEAKRQAGFNCGHIYSVANGKRKTHKGFVWKYV